MINPKERSENGRRTFLKRIGVVAGGTLAAGCAGGSSGSSGSGNNNSGPTVSPNDVQTGGKLTLATQADVVKLDPHKTSAFSSFELLENIYQKLVYIDENLKPQPLLAKKWSVNSDKTKWTFELQEDVKFQPPVNKKFKSEDVVYTINRIKDKKTGNPYRSSYMPIQDVIAKDDHTVVFKFDKPFAPFLTILNHGYIVPKGADNSKKYNIGTHPVGTGPFKFKEHQTHSHSTLVAFDNYWKTDNAGNRLPYLDKVTYQVMPEGSSRVTNLKTGEIDIVASIPPSQAKSVQNANNIQFSSVNGTSLEYIGYQTQKKPMNDVKFRQAMSYAISQQSVVKGAYFDYAKTADSSIPVSSPYHQYINIENPFKQNFDKAKQLINKSDYNGSKIEFIAPTTYPDLISIAQIVKDAAGKIGVNLEINKLEWSTMIARSNNGDYHMMPLGWTGLIDPDSWTYLLFHTDEKWNFTKYSNNKVDQLLEKGRHSSGSLKKRGMIYNQALNIIHDDAPYTFLAFPKDIMAWRDRVHGFVHYPNRIPRLGPVSVNQ